MSVEAVRRKGGKVWRVRYRDDAGRERSHVCGSKRDAESFDAEVRRLKRMGALHRLDAGQKTIAEFAADWWRLYAQRELQRQTQEVYAAVFDKHILPRVGAMQLRAFTTQHGAQLRADLERNGVGPAATRKALMLLQGIFTHAVRWGHVERNPMREVAKPSAKRQRAVVPPGPVAVEAMRADLRASAQLRDAVLVCVLAYAGLRPSEALALSWGCVRDRTLVVDRSLVDGNYKVTKTGEIRAVDLNAPLATDLAEWRLANGRPHDEALVFPRGDGLPWRRHDWQNWRRRVFTPAAERAWLRNVTPYDLRHAFCSLLIREGRDPVEVADQAGNSAKLVLDTYGHVFRDMRGAERVSAEVAIKAARTGHVSEKCPREARSASA
jgi:integrase